MNTRHLSLILAASTLSWLPAQATPEVERLRALVAEQERQIRMLEEENAQLKSDAQPRGSRTLQATGTHPVSAQPAPQVSRPAGTREHTVVAGDTLMKIGRRYSVTAEALAKANGMDATVIIRPGQKLKIPGGMTTAATPAPAPASNGTPTNATRSHTVKAGETFFSISRQNGVSIDQLIAANPDAKPSALQVGQKLRIPQSESPSARESTATAAVPTSVPEPAPATAPRPPGRTGARTVIVEGQMAYGAFAAKHGTTTERLNQLNDLDLDARTVLARGSELYVPAQP
jgi:LysM repeat protein